MPTFEEPKQEARINKTKRALVGAMLTLLEKQSFQKITVNDLCETALVSRAAFYLHFEDKYHLLIFCLGEMNRHVMDAANPKDSVNLMRGLLDYIYEKPNVFKNLILKETNQELMEMLNQLFVQEVTSELKKLEADGKAFTIPIPVLAIFVVGGMAYLFSWWIRGGFPVKKEEMIGYLTDLCKGSMHEPNIRI